MQATGAVVVVGSVVVVVSAAVVVGCSVVVDSATFVVVVVDVAGAVVVVVVEVLEVSPTRELLVLDVTGADVGATVSSVLPDTAMPPVGELGPADSTASRVRMIAPRAADESLATAVLELGLSASGSCVDISLAAKVRTTPITPNTITTPVVQTAVIH